MSELSPMERDVYGYIESMIENEGYAPSVRDICRALGIRSTSTAHACLSRLDQKGYIKKDQGKSRALRLGRAKYSDGERMLRVPLLGRVTAGTPILAVENYDGYVDFPVSMAGGESDLFALRVIEAGILDGDIVIVNGVHYAENGEIVVAMIEDEATVKKFYKENGCVRLQPCNASMQPIYAKNVTILGRVIANFRFYRS